jgi:hypothetical protein
MHAQGGVRRPYGRVSNIRRPWRYVPADRISSMMNANTSSGGAQSNAPRPSSVKPPSDIVDAWISVVAEPAAPGSTRTR